MNWLKSLAVKAAQMRWPAWGGSHGANVGGVWDSLNWTGVAGSNYDYTQSVGQVGQQPVVRSCIAWMQRAAGEPRLQVVTEDASGEENAVPKHPLLLRMKRPNPFGTARQLWQPVIADWVDNGNAFVRKVRNSAGDPIELYHLPRYRVFPQWPGDGRTYISHYLYKVDGKDENIPVENIIHFRFDKDPENERLGWSPVLAGLREMAALNEGANYRGSLLRNRAVASHWISAKDAVKGWTKEQAQAMERLYLAKATGDGSGRPIFSSIPADITKIGYSPAELDLGTMLNWDADLVCALLGLSSMVVGITSGSEHKTYANFAEAREAAFEQCIIPMLGDFAETLTLQLLPDFGDIERERVTWDFSGVRILQEDQTALWKRLNDAVTTGWMLPNEARAMVNLPEIEGGDQMLPDQRAERAEAAFSGEEPESRGDRAVIAAQPAPANGNGKALALPPEVRITKDDVAESEVLWDSTMEGFAGILSAEPVTANGNGLDL